MDDALHALADPIRRKILRMVRARPMSAGSIADAFAVSRPAVSRHLRVLRESGLVSDESSGRERVYRFEPAPLIAVETFVADLRTSNDSGRAAWERRFMRLDTEVHRVRARRKTDRASAPGRSKREAG